VWKGNWAEWCSRLSQSKPLKRRRNSRIQLYCRQCASALPLTWESFGRWCMLCYYIDLLCSPVAHPYYLQYRYGASCRATRLLRTGPSEGVFLPGIPDCHQGALRSFQNTLNFHKLHPLDDLDVIPRCANVLWPMVRIICPTGLSGNPTKVSIAKSTSQAPACR
jgi:hypothetical protein